MRGKKGDVEWDTMIPWIIGIVVLIIVGSSIIYLMGWWEGTIDYIKNLMRGISV